MDANKIETINLAYSSQVVSSSSNTLSKRAVCAEMKRNYAFLSSVYMHASFELNSEQTLYPTSHSCTEPLQGSLYTPSV
jgi:hypothetical protein